MQGAVCKVIRIEFLGDVLYQKKCSEILLAVPSMEVRAETVSSSVYVGNGHNSTPLDATIAALQPLLSPVRCKMLKVAFEKPQTFRSRQEVL